MDGRQEGTGVYWQGLLFSQLEWTNDLYEPHLLGIETCCVEYLVNSLDNFFFSFILPFFCRRHLAWHVWAPGIWQRWIYPAMQTSVFAGTFSL